MSFTTTNLKATISNIEYEWVGGFGTVLISRERGINQGTVRMIGNTIFYAYTVYGRWGIRKINWVPQEEFTAEWIRSFREKVFLS